jgi:hypothetical protein
MTMIDPAHREPVPATPRKAMTPARRKAILAAYDGRCAGCDEPLAGRKWVADHRVALELGGADTLENLQPLCNDGRRCVVGKNRDDARRIAEMRRQSAMRLDVPRRPSTRPIPQRADPWPKGKQKIRSRGFQKRGRN